MLPTLSRRPGKLIWDNPFDLVNEFNRALRRGWEEEGDSAVGAYPVDIHEDDDHIFVEAELPGFTKDDVEVTLEKGVLRIIAQRKVEEKKKGETHLAERQFTRVARAFTLPNTVDETNVDAKLTDGVLHLTLYKHQEVKPSKIQVK